MKKLLILMSLLLAFFSCATAKKKATNKNKPNIIFILADDLGYGDLAYNGGTKIKTPALDKMADDGMVFTRHYAGSTVCGPSRACLMTGLHTGHAPVRENPAWTKSGKPADLSASDNTVAKELKRAGYKTGIIGKWGLAEKLDEGMPLKQGFDYFYGFCTHKAAHHYYPEEIWENDKKVKIEGNVLKEKKGTYSEDLFMDKALDFLDDSKDEPFFLYFASTLPHYELTIAEEEKEYYYKQNWPLRKMRPGNYLHDENGFVTYAAMVTRLDKTVRAIREKLKDLGIDDNTIVIFASDNGHEFDKPKQEFLNSNGEFRGKKRDLYDGGVHIPFIACWPDKIKAGSNSNHVSAFWDFLPTVCDIAGLKPESETDGISYLPSLLGKPEKQEKHDFLYWEFNERRGPIQAILKDDWKLVHFVNKKYELYNLSNDISESNNVIDDFPEVAKELKEKLKDARTEHPEFPLVPHAKLFKKKKK
ncbi:arylsulfatase [Marinifilum sp.]|uniref:arylsulfatase n=1 Tax=Marinifilum sp. TaxID=2033137 RepID=UPI003BACD004